MLATIFSWAASAALALSRAEAEQEDAKESTDGANNKLEGSHNGVAAAAELTTRRSCRLLVRLLDVALDKGAGAYRRYSGYLIADYIRLCVASASQAPSIARFDDALKPIVYRLFQLASAHETQQLHISLDLTHKSQLQTLHNSFLKSYKHSGKI